jgi:uncharacterized protein DUF1569
VAAITDLPDIVLGPLVDRTDGEWYRAPAGKWNCAQIVEHLALGLEWSGKGLEDRRARDPMTRRRRTLFQWGGYMCLVRLGVFPSGFSAPSATVPAPHVDRGRAEAHFREGVARFRELEGLLLPARRFDLFVKHPRAGDLTLEEWVCFHLGHARHHAKQIRRRLNA